MSSEATAQGWKVPVEKISVGLQFMDGHREDADVFLQLATAAGRPQTVLDLLNQPTHFLPVARPDGLRLVHKDMLLWVDAPPDHLLPPDEGVPPAEHGVVLEMAGGHGSVEGRALVTAPPGHRRILDLLNGPEAFFALRSRDGTRILNKQHICSIEPLEV